MPRLAPVTRATAPSILCAFIVSSFLVGFLGAMTTLPREFIAGAVGLAHGDRRQRCVRGVGLRTARTLPLVAPPQKNRSLPSASSPLTVMPAGISRRSRTSPFSGSMRRISLCSPSIVACQSSPSTHETPVTNRSDSMVRRIAPVFASTWWILRARYSPTQSVPSAHVRPESRPCAGAGMLPSTRPVLGSTFWIRSSAICQRCLPSKAVPASAATSSWRTSSPLAGSMAASFSPLANQMLRPSQVTPWTWSMPGNGPYSRTISARFAVLGLVVVFMAASGLTHRQRPGEQQGCRESGQRRRDPAARAPATDRTHRPGFVELAKAPLHRPLACAEGIRERGGGPGLAALEQRQDRPRRSVDRRREHHHRMRRARCEHEAQLGRVHSRERTDGGPHAPDLDAQPHAV